jgi:integrase
MEGVGLHTFRHTHAALLIAAGVDIKTVQRRLGHENVSITLQIYGHLLPGQDERAAQAMDRLFLSTP